MNSEEKRYCEPFNMSPQEYQDYKDSKFTRLIPYAIGMLISSIFIDRWTGYIVLTLLLILSYVDDAKREEQWTKDGSMRNEDLL